MVVGMTACSTKDATTDIYENEQVQEAVDLTEEAEEVTTEVAATEEEVVEIDSLYPITFVDKFGQDVTIEKAEKGKAYSAALSQKLVEKGGITAEQQATLLNLIQK